MKYIVMHASAQMPNSVKAHYRKVAVVETDGSGIRPKMISNRAKHVVRIVLMWDRLHYGRNPKGNTAFERALHGAETYAARLNEGPPDPLKGMHAINRLERWKGIK